MQRTCSVVASRPVRCACQNGLAGTLPQAQKEKSQRGRCSGVVVVVVRSQLSLGSTGRTPRPRSVRGKRAKRERRIQQGATLYLFARLDYGYRDVQTIKKKAKTEAPVAMCNMMAGRGNGNGQSILAHDQTERCEHEPFYFKTREKCTAMFLIIEVTTAASLHNLAASSVFVIFPLVGSSGQSWLQKKKKGFNFSFVEVFHLPSHIPSCPCVRSNL